MLFSISIGFVNPITNLTNPTPTPATKPAPKTLAILLKPKGLSPPSLFEKLANASFIFVTNGSIPESLSVCSTPLTELSTLFCIPSAAVPTSLKPS